MGLEVADAEGEGGVALLADVVGRAFAQVPRLGAFLGQGGRVVSRENLLSQ